MSLRRDPEQVAASTLLCDKVHVASGATLGLVYDLLVDQPSGNLQYVVVSLGTILDAGDDLKGIPWSTVEVDWKSLSLSVSTRDDDPPSSTPALTSESWLPISLRDSASDPRGEFELKRNGEASLETGAKLLRLQSILGARVENSLGESLGKLEELVIDLRQGKIAYAVISRGGILGIGSKLFAIPWKALSPHPSHPTFVFNVAQEVLDQAPGFDAEEWSSVPSMSNWRVRRITHHGFQRSRD